MKKLIFGGKFKLGKYNKGHFLTTELWLGVQPQLGRPAQCPLFRLPLYFWAFLEI
jgi:hypothetical protein